MAQVKLFGNLQRQAGTTAVSASGATLIEVLQTLFISYPQLETAVLNGDQPQPHVRIMVNGHDSELQEGLKTAVSDQDTIAIFPPIAGG